MRLGAMVHDLLLSQQRKYVVWGKARRGRDWEEFKAEWAGKEIVSHDEYLAAMQIAKAVTDHPPAWILFDGALEKKISWWHGKVECSGTPDCLRDDMVVELKVVSSARPEDVARKCRQFMWHAQLAWYSDGENAKRLIERRNRDGVIVAVESAPPFVVSVLKLSDRSMSLGTRTWRLLLERLVVCEQSRSWPGYVADTAPLDIDDSYEEDLKEEIGE
jgi:hypothetical protein